LIDPEHIEGIPAHGPRPLVPIQQQLSKRLVPVVLINVFAVMSAMATYPSSALTSPHLFSRVAVPRLCTA
jgi:hypothetical protein